MSYDDIVDAISPELSKAINNLLNDPEQVSNDLLDLVDFHKTKQGKNAILLKLITTLANEILEQIPNDFVSVTIDNIRENSKNESPNVKFDLNFELSPAIKPFVEYEIVINDVPLSRQKATFQLNASVSMNDLEIKYESKKKVIWLGEMSVVPELIASFEIFGNKPSVTRSFDLPEFTIDLSTFKISAE